jgi:hypothetical protein
VERRSLKIGQSPGIATIQKIRSVFADAERFKGEFYDGSPSVQY